ncbi:MAG: hypothetical protein LBV16_05100 [Elusimicrobiota bacterium]|nr:hypothetical protein [Elusimicrobiota bacterium]
MKKPILFLVFFVIVSVVVSCSIKDKMEDMVDAIVGNSTIVVELTGADGDFGINGELYEDTYYYVKGTIYRDDGHVSIGHLLAQQIEWEDVTSGYKLIDLIEGDETYSTDTMQIKTKTLNAGVTKKDALLQAYAFFASGSPKKQ